MEYGLWKDLGQRELPEQIEQAIGSDFGLNQENSCMQIQIVHKEIGEYVLAAEYCPKEINIGKKLKLRTWIQNFLSAESPFKAGNFRKLAISSGRLRMKSAVRVRISCSSRMPTARNLYRANTMAH